MDTTPRENRLCPDPSTDRPAKTGGEDGASHLDPSVEVNSVQARLQTGYYDRPRVKAKIIGALMESLWLQQWRTPRQ